MKITDTYSGAKRLKQRNSSLRWVYVLVYFGRHQVVCEAPCKDNKAYATIIIINKFSRKMEEEVQINWEILEVNKSRYGVTSPFNSQGHIYIEMKPVVVKWEGNIF